jgi:hypothetical protein
VRLNSIQPQSPLLVRSQSLLTRVAALSGIRFVLSILLILLVGRYKAALDQLPTVLIGIKGLDFSPLALCGRQSVFAECAAS